MIPTECFRDGKENIIGYKCNVSIKTVQHLKLGLELYGFKIIIVTRARLKSSGLIQIIMSNRATTFKLNNVCSKFVF